MAQNDTQSKYSVNLIAYVEALFDVLHHLAFIFFMALGIGLLMYVRVDHAYQPLYTSSTVMTVHQSGMRRSSFADSSNASSAADKFSAILNSNILRKKVAEELGMPGFSGTTSASVVENTNIINISVTASTPALAFREMKGVLENYTIVSSKLMGGLTLTVLEAPQVPKSPNNVPQGLKSGLRAGVIAAVLLALLFFVLSLTRDTIRTESDVHHKLKTKLLVSIQHEKKFQKSNTRKNQKGQTVLITDNTASFYYVETLRRLARRVRDILDEKHAKTLLISSVRDHEGKSTVSVNLALALSEEKKKVLLIDGDLRKPDLYQLLGISEKKIRDYGEVLGRKNQNPDDSGTAAEAEEEAGNEIYGYLVQYRNLYCLLNTRPVIQGNDAVASGSFSRILEELKEKVDYIIVDSSPVALTADSEELVHASDATAIVVRQNLVEASAINDAIDVLNDRKKKKFIGCIFNDVHHVGTVQTYGYSYGYGNYGHYGRYGKYGYGHYGQLGRYGAGTEGEQTENE